MRVTNSFFVVINSYLSHSELKEKALTKVGTSISLHVYKTNKSMLAKHNMKFVRRHSLGDLETWKNSTAWFLERNMFPTTDVWKAYLVNKQHAFCNPF